MESALKMRGFEVILMSIDADHENDLKMRFLQALTIIRLELVD